MKHSPEFVAICDEARGRIRELTLEEYLDAPEAWTLVDVREESEFQAFQVPGSVYLGKGVLERDAVQRFGKAAPLLLMCGGGYRSALAAEALQRMGFDHVASLAGGIKGWWRHLLARGGAVSGLSVRSETTVPGDLHVQGDLDVRAPLTVQGLLTVDGLLESSAPLRCRDLRAKAALLSGPTRVDGAAHVRLLLGEMECPDLTAGRLPDGLPPAFQDDPSGAVRAWVRGRLVLDR